ncbi:DUF2633 family protein [Candidatus Blochmanniella camponoti]|uniref:DUF2633 family protein n=1 Tax=Candidatus Blochmanniella camponoti TaxID=108080 RepID=A0ABY4SSC5_9ENTR|nr:DUF2633 family protein [Candidatus Blochmannia herculeanus]URJ24353.1 DUF2633 family protein [Candidatus Blochmannia herculeanus]
MKRKKKKIRVAKWILLISFTILFARLIYASVNAWNYHKNRNNNAVIPTIYLNNNRIVLR